MSLLSSTRLPITFKLWFKEFEPIIPFLFFITSISEIFDILVFNSVFLDKFFSLLSSSLVSSIPNLLLDFIL